MKKHLIEFYLDYFNNYLTVEKIAEHNEIDPMIAEQLINIGRDLHEANVEMIKENKQ